MSIYKRAINNSRVAAGGLRRWFEMLDRLAVGLGFAHRQQLNVFSARFWYQSKEAYMLSSGNKIVILRN